MVGDLEQPWSYCDAYTTLHHMTFYQSAHFVKQYVLALHKTQPQPQQS